MEQKSILIVEDEQIAALDLREILRSLGYRVMGTAASGEKAVAMADAEVPDLILMDIHLGGEMSGIDAAERILAHHSVPIIYITAYADPGLVERAKKTRPYGYIIKPYDERALRTEIEIALYKFGLDQNFQQEYANLAQWVQERTDQLARVNEALKKSEARYRLIFERSGEGIFIFEAEGEDRGRIVEVNPAGAVMHGYPVEELLRLKMTDLDVPESRDGAPLRIQAILNGEWIGGELNHVRKDGSVFPIDFHAGLLELEGHRYVFSVIRDITDKKEIQDEIVRARDEWEYTFNAVPDLIALIDDHYRVIRVNQAMADRLGMAPEEVIGKYCYEIVHHAENPPPVCPHTLLLEDSQCHSAEVHEDNLNGDFSLTVAPIRDPSGPLIGSVHILRDITEQKQAEQQIQESEAKFREIFNSANDAIHLHEVDERGLPGKFIDVNDMACRMLQYSKDELLNINPLDLTTSYHSIPLDQIGEELRLKGSVIFETEHKRRDGSIVPVEVNAHFVVIRRRRMVLSIIRDLSRRKRDEIALRTLSTELQTIIDNAPGMIWYKDTKNNFVRVNPAGARAFGLPVERIIGKNAEELFPHLAEHYYQDDLEVIRSGKPKLGIVEQMTSARGETLWVQSDKVPILDEKGNVAGVLVFVVDITERKIAQDALALANKKLGLMASITRHDILNQIMALNAYLELSRDASPGPEIADFLQKMAKISASIERHIAFTRDYQTIGVQAPQWQDVGACVFRSTASLPMGNIRVATDLHDVKVLADPLFEKIFYNLIDNTLRYGGDGTKHIQISSEETTHGLTIIVEDDGAGVAAEDRPHLFTKGFGKNTGLGLFLTREILSITGIEIRETGMPGKGARFEITVPKGAYRISR